MSHATNEWVAGLLGISNSMVSRLRSGDRKPSIRLMLKIAEKFGWSVDDQAYAISYGRYGEEFERHISAPTADPTAEEGHDGEAATP